MRTTSTAAALTLSAVLMLSVSGCQVKGDIGTAYTVTCAGNAICHQPCKPLTDWTGDKDDEYIAWLLGQHADEQAQCDAQRGACAECLDAIERAGVTR